jgi:S1-C subfamily serine protease
MDQANPPSVGELEARVIKLEHDAKHPKDAWDKLGAISGLASGILVALIGFYATNLYDRHSKQAEEFDRQRGLVAVELQTVEKFFPHLASKDDTERQGAIQAISTLANPDLAAKMAKVFGGTGARAALAQIASASSAVQSSVSSALTDLYKEFGAATGLIELTCKSSKGGLAQATQGTASMVTKNGFALTAGHLFDIPCIEDSIEISFTIGSRSNSKIPATLVKRDLELDLALIRVPGADYQPVKIGSDPIRSGDAVTIVGYALNQGLTALATAVFPSSKTAKFALNAPPWPGLSGAPIFNSRGEVIGVFLGPSKSGLTLAVAIQFAEPLLTVAGAR